MARLEDIPQPTRDAVVNLPCPAFDTRPFASGVPLSQRRVAILTSAALIRRGDQPFPVGTGEARAIPSSIPAGEQLISHVSINFDRSGFQRDRNVVFPLDRLQELAVEGVIGSVADTHYTVMGSTDPAAMADSVAQVFGLLQQDKVDAVLLTPV
jgi:D-proline reductase (dithiol) PrdB